jgi:hypothetical protein
MRLVDRINRLFGDPPIACHHDFSQSYFERSHFPANVEFVRPHVQTRWGTISLVHAMLRALRLLYDSKSPDWFYLLSGSDYPIRDRDAVTGELSRSPFDAYIQVRKIDHRQAPPRGIADSGGLDSASYLRLAYERYIARSLPIPSWRHPHRGPAAAHLHFTHPTLLKPFHPFTDSYHCYAGSQWFAANARSAAALLAPENERLLKYFAGRFPPDEAFCPTVLGNAKDLKVCGENKHYVSWERGHHPRLLDVGDVPAMLASGAHFARKLAADAPVLDLLDAHLGIAAPALHCLRS